MNYYNKKLNELIKSAEEYGYSFDGKKFVKNADSFYPVMEVFLQMHTTYEDSGHYYIYKNTFEISKDDLEKMLNYSKENNTETISFKKDENFYALYEKIISKYLIMDKKCYLFNCSFDGKVSIFNDTYYKYRDEQNVADFYFQYKDNDLDSDFPIGYISFYKMSYNDFQKAENVNMELHKFMRYN